PPALRERAQMMADAPCLGLQPEARRPVASIEKAIDQNRRRHLGSQTFEATSGFERYEASERIAGELVRAVGLSRPNGLNRLRRDLIDGRGHAIAVAARKLPPVEGPRRRDPARQSGEFSAVAAAAREQEDRRITGSPSGAQKDEAFAPGLLRCCHVVSARPV